MQHVGSDYIIMKILYFVKRDHEISHSVIPEISYNAEAPQNQSHLSMFLSSRVRARPAD